MKITDNKMLTEECKAILKQKEAIKNEQKYKYNIASSLYSAAKVIWQRVNGSKMKQQFCESRKKQCEAMAIISEVDDDDEYL